MKYWAVKNKLRLVKTIKQVTNTESKRKSAYLLSYNMSSRGIVFRNDRSDSIDVQQMPLSPNIIITNYFNGLNGEKEEGNVWLVLIFILVSTFKTHEKKILTKIITS